MSYQPSKRWTDLVKQTIARFASNASARQGRVLLPSEQAERRERLAPLLRRWKERAS